MSARRTALLAEVRHEQTELADGRERAPSPTRRAAALRLAADALDRGDLEERDRWLDEVEAIEEMAR